MSEIVRESDPIPHAAVISLPIGKGRKDITWIIPIRNGITFDEILDEVIPEYMNLDPDLATKDFTTAQLKTQMKRRVNPHRRLRLLKFDNGDLGYKTETKLVTLTKEEFRLLNKKHLQ